MLIRYDFLKPVISLYQTLQYPVQFLKKNIFFSKITYRKRIQNDQVWSRLLSNG